MKGGMKMTNIEILTKEYKELLKQATKLADERDRYYCSENEAHYRYIKMEFEKVYAQMQEVLFLAGLLRDCK